MILIAEDNPADQEIIRRVLEEVQFSNQYQFVSDGVETMDYLCRRGKFADPVLYPDPDMLLLDINMPRKDGLEVLQEIKNDANLKLLPVVVFTTSSQERDVVESYKLGVNAYITKPMSVRQFRDIINKLHHFWMVLATLPSRQPPTCC